MFDQVISDLMYSFEKSIFVFSTEATDMRVVSSIYFRFWNDPFKNMLTRLVLFFYFEAINMRVVFSIYFRFRSNPFKNMLIGLVCLAFIN